MRFGRSWELSIYDRPRSGGVVAKPHRHGQHRALDAAGGRIAARELCPRLRAEGQRTGIVAVGSRG